MARYTATMEDLSCVNEGTDSWVRYRAESADRRVSETMGREVSRVGKGTLLGLVSRLDLYAAVVGTDADQEAAERLD